MRLTALRPPRRVREWLDQPAEVVFRQLLALNLVVVALTLVVGCPLGDLKRRPLGPLTPFNALFAPEIVCTVVSFAQLWMSGYVLYQVYRLRRDQLLREGGRADAARVWLLMCVGFFYMAVDEVAFLHEGLGKLPFLLGLPRTPLTIRIDDLIPVGYGLVGLAVLAWYRAEFRGYLRFWRWVCAGMAVGLLSVVLDVITHRKDFLWWWLGDPVAAAFWWAKLNALEEGCKIVAEAIFLGMFVACRDTARGPEAAGGPVAAPAELAQAA